jgi:GT2 family glycosyltransferase
MRLAWTSAANHNPDYFLLANDDTLLDSIAVRNLVEIVGSPDARTIAVAAIRDPESGMRTYGGLRRGIGIFAKNTAVAVSGKVEACDTFNANAALVPKAVHQELGIFHEVYTHGMGDYDYGFRASEQDIQVLQSAVFLGTCPRNSTTGTWRDTSLSRLQRFKKLQSPKGLPWKEWGIFNRRNTGWLWLIRTVSPYVKVLFRL